MYGLRVGMNKKYTKTIYVGLSGGVDSAVSAALLKEEGNTVVGVFIRTWHPEGFPCTQGEDEREAMRVAAHLDIPFKTLDLSARYKDEVAKHFIEGYTRGETPNPDVLCNREVKFGSFVDFARREGADGIATGHYARLIHNGDSVELLKGKDASKDQSYFLSLVPKEQLVFARFPVGGYEKSEVRKLAKRFKLPNATRKDSQGICFLGAIDLKEFLSKYTPIKSGDVISQSGALIGTHEGAPLYTLGQRHGFTISKNDSGGEPMYVQSTNVQKNTITVTSKKFLKGSTIFKLREVNVLGAFDGCLEAILRYHANPVDAHALIENSTITVTLSEPMLAASGQTLAMYKNDSLVLAGVIDEAIHST